MKTLCLEKTFVIILLNYLNWGHIFLVINAMKLPKYIWINDYIIKLEEDKQSFFNLIYSLKPIKLKMLKIYIKTNLANNFISFLKFFAEISIFLI